MLDGKSSLMQNHAPTEKTSPFWQILPFIITGCFVVPMAVSGPKPGEAKSFWCIFLPGVALCIFPWAKLVALGIQTWFKAKTLYITKEAYESNPELTSLKHKTKKWVRITVLTWIVVFLSMMVGVSILNAGKSESGHRRNGIGRGASNESHRPNDYHPLSAAAGKAKLPPAFIENSAVHKRLQFYDNLIYRLIPLPFLGMLAGAIYLIRSLIGRWWKKGKKTPLAWKIVPFAAIACFILPITLSFAIAAPMETTIRTEALRFLSSFSDNATVIINGKAVGNPHDVISQLATLAVVQAHHSHPTHRIRIQVVGSDYSLTLELGRDSELPSEYWVFYPGYHHTRLNEIGRTTTKIFDSY